MEALKERIRREGKNLGSGILKVDSFINHQVDAGLMQRMGITFAERFAEAGVTGISKVITAEVSGITPALATAQAVPRQIRKTVSTKRSRWRVRATRNWPIRP